VTTTVLMLLQCTSLQRFTLRKSIPPPTLDISLNDASWFSATVNSSEILDVEVLKDSGAPLGFYQDPLPTLR
jgi:hypothetical protein